MTEPELRALAARDAILSAEEIRVEAMLRDLASLGSECCVIFASEAAIAVALLDAEREKVRVLREALVGIRSWMPPSGSDPELDEAMCRVDHALATTEPKP